MPINSSRPLLNISFLIVFTLLKQTGALSGVGLSPWRPVFNPRPVNVEFLGDKAALGQVYLRKLRFSHLITNPPMIHTHSFRYHHRKITSAIYLHHHHISVMGLGQLLTRSGLTYPEVSSKVCHDSFCQLENSVSSPWVIYEAFYLHVVFIFSYIPVICPKLVLFLIPL